MTLTVKEYADRERGEHWPFKSPERLAHERTERRGGVYYIRSGNWVKIGISTSITGRLKEMRQLNPHECRIVGWEPMASGKAFERELALHEQFKGQRHRGEWFRLTPELAAHIKEHAQPWIWEA